jgi:hypothetical protein
VGDPAPAAAEDDVRSDDEQPQSLEVWRTEILHLIGQVMQGRVVGIWEATDDSVVPVVISGNRPLPSSAAAEINDAMRRWRVPIATGSRWLACRLDMGRWCIAPVRYDVPAPAPGGLERRKRERLALELAGRCLGLAELQFRDTAE